jgi:hypothetical protein
MNKLKLKVLRPLRILFCVTLALIIGPGAGMAAAVVDDGCGMVCCGSIGSGMMALETGCRDQLPVSSCDQLPDDSPPLFATVTGRPLSSSNGTVAVGRAAEAPIRGIETDGTLLIRNPEVPAFQLPPLYLSNASFLI